MFEKQRNTSEQSASTSISQAGSEVSASNANRSSRVAVIGPRIRIKGDISGDENLVVEGKVNGKIRLKSHNVQIGETGQVHADVFAKTIKVAGEVRGDLNATEKVVISRTGNIQGNIIAPRMTLEDGAIFKGSIDMDPSEPEKAKVAKPAKPAAHAVPKATKKETEDSSAKAGGAAKVVASDKAKKDANYTLNGG